MRLQIRKLQDFFRRQASLVLIIIISAIIIVVAQNLAIISVASKDMLQSMIQAEATVLGFFGLIATYLLTSFDSRLDRLEQQCFDCEVDNKHRYNKLIIKYEDVKTLKSGIVENVAVVGIILILALLSSIITLGMVDLESTQSIPFGNVGFVLFFTGIVALILLFMRASEKGIN